MENLVILNSEKNSELINRIKDMVASHAKDVLVIDSKEELKNLGVEFVYVGSLEEHEHSISVENVLASDSKNLVIFTPKESPDHQKNLKKIGDALVCLIEEPQPETLRKNIEEINRTFKLKSTEVLDVKPVSGDDSPWYDRFIKKWRRDNYKSSRPNPKRKWKKY